jgi:hypothetical protein
MKFELLILALLIGLKSNAQQTGKIYYDNRSNSVVEYCSKSKVIRMLAENPIWILYR